MCLCGRLILKRGGLEVEKLKNKVTPKVDIIKANKVDGNLSMKDYNKRKDIRVAAYCRVSTREDKQKNSYERQKEYYTMLIQQNGWVCAGIYADEALSGTGRKWRPQFNQMMEDAEAGKIDLIITKSISRFARNTVDAIQCIRKLKGQRPAVGIIFEKEGINTFEYGSEFMLTILSAHAQEESRTISENIRWGIRSRFMRGIPQVNPNYLYGYRKGKGKDADWLVDEIDADWVRWIYKSYLEGKSGRKIASELNEQGVCTRRGKMWTGGAIMSILRNEVYIGDCLMQKNMTTDYLEHKSVLNDGSLDKFYVRDHHQAIVSREVWELVQKRLQDLA